jgi:hypothetical protein
LETLASLKQAVTEASEIVANFIWLTVELNYRDFDKKHTDVFALYLELLVYTAILIYICDHPEIEIKPSMTEKIIRNTQETTLTMEGYVDTIEIDADPESAALERIKSDYHSFGVNWLLPR